jgi:hypothetical protein
MNGPDHYRKAERLLAMAEQGSTGTVDLTDGEIGRMTAGAQVHATLALAAAAATQFVIDAPDTRIGEDWEDAMSEPRDEDDDTSYAGTGAPMAQPGPEPAFAEPPA